MKVTINRKNQIISFIPVHISIDDRPYQKLNKDNSIFYDTDKSWIKIEIKMLDMKRLFAFNLDNNINNDFELYFNLDYSKYIIVIGLFFSILYIIFSIFIRQSSSWFYGFISSVFCIQSLFNTLIISIK